MEEPIRQLTVSAYRIPTDQPESDGTLAWDATTMIVVRVQAGNETGLGYTYSHAAAAQLIDDKLRKVVESSDAMNVRQAWEQMHASTRNLGQPGIVSCAISAVDVALWDLKARLLKIPLVALFGAVRNRVEVYGSGGFTSYSQRTLQDQLAGWVGQGINSVKMKVGREPGQDVARVRAAREAIGKEPALMVDANGGYDRQQALSMAQKFAEYGVSWFEEPVPAWDLAGTACLRQRVPPGMEIALGEYGYQWNDFQQILQAEAVDVLMADGTRCGGYTGFLGAATICRTAHLPLSAHTAPNFHAHVGCACPSLRHIEYFHDHTRIEQMLLDGALSPIEGCLHPDPSRPGLGLQVKEKEARQFLVWQSS